MVDRYRPKHYQSHEKAAKQPQPLPWQVNVVLMFCTGALVTVAVFFIARLVF